MLEFDLFPFPGANTPAMKLYERAERISSSIFSAMAYSLTLVDAVLLSAPLGHLLFRYFRGHYSQELRIQPYKMR